MMGVRAAVAFGLATAVTVAAVAVAAPRNGGFEGGDLRGWKTRGVNGNDGTHADSLWQVYPASSPRGGSFFLPPSGEFAASVDFLSRPGLEILHRKLRLRKGRINKLSFFPAWTTQNDDGFEPRKRFRCTLDDLQFRVDILKPKAPRDSLRKRHILTTLFRTKADTPTTRAYERKRYNLTRRGVNRRLVRLRVAARNNVDAFFIAGIDQVKQRAGHRLKGRRVVTPLQAT